MKKLSEVFLFILSFALLIAGIIYTQHHMENHLNKNKETIYFVPKKNQINYTTFGYKSIIADIMWLRSVSYFLTHLGGDNDYKYLGAMYSTCIELDPNFKQVYKDAMNFLMNEPENYLEGEKILLKGVEKMPHDWEIHYMLGFAYSYYLKDSKKAIQYLSLAQKLIPRDGTLPGELKKINILMRTNTEKELDEFGLVTFWLDSFQQKKSKALQSFYKKNVLKYLNRTMANSLNKTLDKELSKEQINEILSQEHKAFLIFCQGKNVANSLQLNWKKIFIKEDANGYPWVFSAHKNKYYSFGNAKANIKRKLSLFNFILWEKLDKYYTIPFKELIHHPYDKRAELIKLKPQFKAFPSLEEIISMGLKIKLETPLYPLYDQKKGCFKIPTFKDLENISDQFK